MKSLMVLLQCVLSDAETWCCTSAARDLQTISSRYEHEGLSFLTITLPNFAKDFERSLELGYVDPSLFSSFKRKGGLPLFLGGFLGLVFDRGTGMILDVPSKDAIFFIRQICLMFKKILLPCTQLREKKAYDQYINTENSVRDWTDSARPQLIAEFSRMSSLLWALDLSALDRMVFEQQIIPKHGPGATADRITGNRKYDIRTWTDRLEGFFPSELYVIPNQDYVDTLQSVEFLGPEQELPSRVVSVPKTLKTPRIIAIEPVCMQYAQQALLEILVDGLERSDYLSGAIGFTDQFPNQWMAQLGSADGSLATLDLSEASDRVSNLLVVTMFAPFPSLAGAIQASRTTRADVPGYGIIPLSKFASMGSATCFPVEAMVFLTIVMLAIESDVSHTLTRKEINSILRSVRVYGDDIIVPREHVRSVIDYLHLFGMKVNVNKSFWTGKFRESCGGDFYDGTSVTPVYLRRLLPTSRKNAPEMISTISFRNQAYKAGMWKTARYLDQLIGGLAPFPTVLDTSPVLGRHSFLGYDTQRMCDRLHRPLVKGMVTKSVIPRSPISGVGSLMKFFLKRGEEPYLDEKHLERFGRPLSVDIKIRWASST